MDRQSIATQLQIEQGLIGHIEASLRAVLEWKTEPSNVSRKLSTLRFIAETLHRQLERLMAIDEYDGYMSHVLHSSPQFASAVAVLKNDHEALRLELNQIVARLERTSSEEVAAVDAACDDVRNFLAGYDEHNEREVELLQNSLLRDIGGRG